MMEDEWHVSDSEDEQETDNYTQFIASNLKGLCPVSRQDITNHLELCIPKNLNTLYERIENEGFIALRCEGSKRDIETVKDDAHSKISQVNHKNVPACNGINVTNSTDTVVSNDEAPCIVKETAARSEFDYDEDMMETTVRLPKRKQKSERDKNRKSKRVGTMEKVINDLNRFKRLNAQAMATESNDP